MKKKLVKLEESIMQKKKRQDLVIYQIKRVKKEI